MVHMRFYHTDSINCALYHAIKYFFLTKIMNAWVLTLSLPRVPKKRIQDKPQISFCKILTIHSTIRCESAAKGVSSTDSKGTCRTTLNVSMTDSGSERVNILPQISGDSVSELPISNIFWRASPQTPQRPLFQLRKVLTSCSHLLQLLLKAL